MCACKKETERKKNFVIYIYYIAFSTITIYCRDAYSKYVIKRFFLSTCVVLK